MTETPAIFPDPYMLTIVTDTGVKCPKNVAKMTYIKNKNIYEAIQRMRKKGEYETDIHKNYNIIVEHTNKQLQEKWHQNPHSRHLKQAKAQLVI